MEQLQASCVALSQVRHVEGRTDAISRLMFRIRVVATA